MSKVVVPDSISYFKFNRDGSFRYAEPCHPDVYIDDQQFGRLMNKDTVSNLIERYGDTIAVMHRKIKKSTVSVQTTHMFMLGK